MQAQHEVKSWLPLYVVISECAAIFQPLACKDEALLVWWDSLFVLDFGSYIFNRVTSLNFESDGFTSVSLHEDMHTTTKLQLKAKGGLFLDVVVR